MLGGQAMPGIALGTPEWLWEEASSSARMAVQPPLSASVKAGLSLQSTFEEASVAHRGAERLS